MLRDWDDKYGDRMQKIVLSVQHLDKEQLVRGLRCVFGIIFLLGTELKDKHGLFFYSVSSMFFCA